MTVSARVSPHSPAPALPLRLSERRTLLGLVDAVMLVASVVIALWLWTLRGDLQFSLAFLAEEAQWFFVLGGLWAVTAVLYNFYRPEITASFTATALSLLRINATMLVLYLLIYFVSPPTSVNRVVVLFFGVLSLALVGAWRAVYTLALHGAFFEQRILILGAGTPGQVMAHTIHDNLDKAYRVVGFVDDAAPLGELVDGAPVLGGADSLVRLTQQYGVAEIVLAQPDLTSATVFQAVLDCQEQGVRITPMALLYESITGRVPVEHVGDQWYIALPLDHHGHSMFYSGVKRAFDLIGALVGLCLYGPLLPFLALAIRLDSPGPVFYRQKRVGKGGRVFEVYKLRTMIQNAEPDQPVWAAIDDPRVTRVGRLLRKTRLDELPQLLNILLGDMSFVGPRPERPEMVAELEARIPFYRARHSIRPGATGWAFVNNGYARSVEETLLKLQYDLYYIKHQSPVLDLLIILKSIVLVLTMRGA